MQIDKKTKTYLIKNFIFYREGCQQAFLRFIGKLEQTDTYEEIMEVIRDFLVDEVEKLHIGVIFNPFCIAGYFGYPFYQSEKCPYRIRDNKDFCYMRELIAAKTKFVKAIEKIYQGESYKQ